MRWGLICATQCLVLASHRKYPGRLELVPARRQFSGFRRLRPYADALGNVLKTLRELEPHRLIAVFWLRRQSGPAEAPVDGPK